MQNCETQGGCAAGLQDKEGKKDKHSLSTCCIPQARHLRYINAFNPHKAILQRRKPQRSEVICSSRTAKQESWDLNPEPQLPLCCGLGAKDLALPPSSCVSVKVFIAQSCSILCDPMDCSPPGSSGHGILQARILEWVAIPFYRESSQPRNENWVSCIASRFSIV